MLKNFNKYNNYTLNFSYNYERKTLLTLKKSEIKTKIYYEHLLLNILRIKLDVNKIPIKCEL